MGNFLIYQLKEEGEGEADEGSQIGEEQDDNLGGEEIGRDSGVDEDEDGDGDGVGKAKGTRKRERKEREAKEEERPSTNGELEEAKTKRDDEDVMNGVGRGVELEVVDDEEELNKEMETFHSVELDREEGEKMIEEARRKEETKDSGVANHVADGKDTKTEEGEDDWDDGKENGGSDGEEEDSEDEEEEEMKSAKSSMDLTGSEHVIVDQIAGVMAEKLAKQMGTSTSTSRTGNEKSSGSQLRHSKTNGNNASTRKQKQKNRKKRIKSGVELTNEVLEQLEAMKRLDELASSSAPSKGVITLPAGDQQQPPAAFISALTEALHNSNPSSNLSSSSPSSPSVNVTPTDDQTPSDPTNNDNQAAVSNSLTIASSPIACPPNLSASPFGGKIEDEWCIVTSTPDLDEQADGDAGTLTVSTISIEKDELTGLATSPARVTQLVLPHHHRPPMMGDDDDEKEEAAAGGLSSSILGAFNVLGFFSSSASHKPNDRDDPEFLRSKLHELQQQVAQIDSLKGQVGKLSTILDQIYSQSIAGGGSISVPLIEDAAPPPPPPPPPPPAPPPPTMRQAGSSSGATSLGAALSAFRSNSDDSISTGDDAAPQANGNGAADDNLESRESCARAVRELVEASETAKIDAGVEAYMKIYDKNAPGLRKLIMLYPFLITKLPRKPAKAFSRMRYWEKNLFAGLEEERAKVWRKRKAFEIGRTDLEEDMARIIDAVKKTIEADRIKEREAEARKKQEGLRCNMMGELQATLSARQAKMKPEDEQGSEDEQEDFDESDFAD